jgi:hypothetical protein
VIARHHAHNAKRVKDDHSEADSSMFHRLVRWIAFVALLSGTVVALFWLNQNMRKPPVRPGLPLLEGPDIVVGTVNDHGITLRVAVKSHTKRGEPIPLQLILTNGTDRQIGYNGILQEGKWGIRVVDILDNSPDLTPNAPRLFLADNRRYRGSALSLALKPGESLVGNFDLAKYLVLKPNIYWVSSCIVLDDAGDTCPSLRMSDVAFQVDP